VPSECEGVADTVRKGTGSPYGSPDAPDPPSIASVRTAMSVDAEDDYTPGQLTEGWRWVLAVSWALLLPAMLALADAANSFGKPTWWMSDEATAAWHSPIPFLAPLLVTAAAAANWRRWPIAAVIGVLGLGASALVDAGRTPSVAVGEAALAGAGLLVSVACLAGRVRRPQG